MVLPPTHPHMKAARAAQAKAAEQAAATTQAQAKRKGSRGKGIEVAQLDSLKQINLNAAGLDIGSAEIWACVPEGRDEVSVRVFQTFTVDLNALADWLQACGIDTVAMESTGVYWIPIYEILEAKGFEVYLVNARHLSNVTGKKIDILDCQWIQQLHTYGLLRASFRPQEGMVALRVYIRHRDNLIRDRATHIQRMQKALSLMNIQLNNVIRDITGQTGSRLSATLWPANTTRSNWLNTAILAAAAVKTTLPKPCRVTTVPNTCLPSNKPWICMTITLRKSMSVMSKSRPSLPPSNRRWISKRTPYPRPKRNASAKTTLILICARPCTRPVVST